jgi:hypothetical protein
MYAVKAIYDGNLFRHYEEDIKCRENFFLGRSEKYDIS